MFVSPDGKAEAGNPLPQVVQVAPITQLLYPAFLVAIHVPPATRAAGPLESWATSKPPFPRWRPKLRIRRAADAGPAQSILVSSISTGFEHVRSRASSPKNRMRAEEESNEWRHRTNGRQWAQRVRSDGGIWIRGGTEN